MKWDFSTVGSKEECKRYVDQQLFVAGNKGEVKPTPASRVSTSTPVAANDKDADGKRDDARHHTPSRTPLKQLEQHGVDAHAPDPGKLDLSRLDVGAGEPSRHDTPKIVVETLKQMIDAINLDSGTPDPRVTYGVSVKSDGQGDDTTFSGRFEVSRIMLGKSDWERRGNAPAPNVGASTVGHSPVPSPSRR